MTSLKANPHMGLLGCFPGFLPVSLLLLTASTVAAQDFAAFRGVITDPSGAAVPSASVKATEEQLGIVQSTSSNDQGEYEIRGIPAGTYTIEVSAPTFKLFKNTGVLVYARGVRRVDVELEVGAVTSSVTVQAEGSRIQTDQASIEYKTGQQEIYALNIPSWLIYRVSLNPGAESRNQVHGALPITPTPSRMALRRMLMDRGARRRRQLKRSSRSR